MKHRPPTRRRFAFTLAEVLATLAMVALILPVVMQGISLATRATSDATGRDRAAQLAELKLYELAHTRATATLLASSGDFAPDHPGFRWTSHEVALNDGLIQLTVEVTWTHREQPQQFTLATWVRDDVGGLLP